MNYRWEKRKAGKNRRINTGNYKLDKENKKERKKLVKEEKLRMVDEMGVEESAGKIIDKTSKAKDKV